MLHELLIPVIRDKYIVFLSLILLWLVSLLACMLYQFLHKLRVDCVHYVEEELSVLRFGLFIKVW